MLKVKTADHTGQMTKLIRVSTERTCHRAMASFKSLLNASMVLFCVNFDVVLDLKLKS